MTSAPLSLNRWAVFTRHFSSEDFSTGMLITEFLNSREIYLALKRSILSSSHCEDSPCCLLAFLVALGHFLRTWGGYCCCCRRPGAACERDTDDDDRSSTGTAATVLPGRLGAVSIEDTYGKS